MTCNVMFHRHIGWEVKGEVASQCSESLNCLNCLKDHDLVKEHTLERDSVKEEMCIRDMVQDSLRQEVATVERNHIKEISSLICLAKEERKKLLPRKAGGTVARNLMNGLTETLKDKKKKRKKKSMGSILAPQVTKASMK